MFPEMIHSAPIEWTYVVVSLIAFSCTTWFFVHASQNYDFLQGNGPIKIVADDKRSGAAIRMMASGFAMIGSIIILFLAPPPPSSTDSPQSLVLIIISILIQTLTVFSSWMSWKAQSELEKYVDSIPPSGGISIKIAQETREKDREIREVAREKREVAREGREERRSTPDRRQSVEEKKIVEARQLIQEDLGEIKKDVKIVKSDVKDVKNDMKEKP